MTRQPNPELAWLNDMANVDNLTSDESVALLREAVAAHDAVETAQAAFTPELRQLYAQWREAERSIHLRQLSFAVWATEGLAALLEMAGHQSAATNITVDLTVEEIMGDGGTP